MHSNGESISADKAVEWKAWFSVNKILLNQKMFPWTMPQYIIH